MPTFEDLTGNKYGRLTVIKRVDDYISPRGYSKIQYLCKCDCGNEKIVWASKLKAGSVSSCGCYRKEKASGSHTELKPGDRFGKLTLVRFESGKWFCKCDCGNECLIKTGALRSGNSTGCGKCRANDFSNKICGDYKVLCRMHKEADTSVYWECECIKCGRKAIFDATRLKKNPSCIECKDRADDLTGKQFGRLTVLERAEDHIAPNGDKKVQWKCQCECGTIKIVSAQHLKRGDTKSCGCLLKQVSSEKRTAFIQGQKFGRLTALSLIKRGPQGNTWHCICECGNECDVTASHLITGATKSCGCLQKERAGEYAFQDLTGKKFGYWTVLYQNGHTKSGIILWRCRCEKCGNEYDIQGGNLRCEETSMCSVCSHIENGIKFRNDLLGQRFGLLTVQSFAYTKNNQTYWNCLCECGNNTTVANGLLMSGNTRSCGCWHRSKYEDWVIQYLETKDIRYIPQYKYSELTGLNGGLLSYDFALVNTQGIYKLIECQGQQHYKAVKRFGGAKQLEVQQLHDDLKREYALSIGVPLIEIPYTLNSYKKIEEFLKQNGV